MSAGRRLANVVVPSRKQMCIGLVCCCRDSRVCARPLGAFLTPGAPARLKPLLRRFRRREGFEKTTHAAMRRSVILSQPSDDCTSRKCTNAQAYQRVSEGHLKRRWSAHLTKKVPSRDRFARVVTVSSRSSVRRREAASRTLPLRRVVSALPTDWRRARNTFARNRGPREGLRSPVTLFLWEVGSAKAKALGAQT